VLIKNLLINFCSKVKKHLSVGYGRFPGYTFDKLSMEKLKKKVGYCKEVLDSIAILEPGLSTQKGLTLYELWMGEVELAERLKSEEKIGNEDFKKALKEAFQYLEESAQIMRYEPENSIHGRLSIDIDIKLQTEKVKLSNL